VPFLVANVHLISKNVTTKKKQKERKQQQQKQTSFTILKTTTIELYPVHVMARERRDICTQINRATFPFPSAFLEKKPLLAGYLVFTE